MIVMNSLDARFSKNFFEAVQRTRSTCFIGSKTTRLRLAVLNPIKHSSSFFKHYLVWRLYHVISQLQRAHYLRTAAGHKVKTKIASLFSETRKIFSFLQLIFLFYLVHCLNEDSENQTNTSTNISKKLSNLHCFKFSLKCIIS